MQFTKPFIETLESFFFIWKQLRPYVIECFMKNIVLNLLIKFNIINRRDLNFLNNDFQGEDYYFLIDFLGAQGFQHHEEMLTCEWVSIFNYLLDEIGDVVCQLLQLLLVEGSLNFG